MLEYLLFLHWIGDFLLQSNFVAIHKSKSNILLFEHVIIYTGVIFTGMALFNLNNPIQFFYFISTNFLLHLVVDYFISKKMTIYNKNKKRHAFFVMLGFGQFLYVTSLLLTYKFFL